MSATGDKAKPDTEGLEGVTFVTRYTAVGIPDPDPATMCRGDCEGTGLVPISKGDNDPVYQRLWREQHAKAHTFRQRVRLAWKYRDVAYLWHRCDGWHFVTCPTCNGTRLRKAS